MKCQRYSLHSSVRGRLPSMQIGSAYLTSMGTSWNMPLLMEKKKKKKEGGSVIQLFSLLLRQGLYENLPATHPQPLPPSQRSKSIFYYCRIQPSSSISSVLSYQWMSTDHRRLWLKSGKMGIFNNAKPSSLEEVYVNMATPKSLATC